MEPSMDMHSRVLRYLRNNGPANTFRLARLLGVDRHKLLDVLRDLEQQGCVELKHGIVIFIKIQEKRRLEQAPMQEKKAAQAPAVRRKNPRNKGSKQRFYHRKLPRETSPMKISLETSALDSIKKENKTLMEMNKNLEGRNTTLAERAALLEEELKSASKAKQELDKLKEAIKNRQQRKKKEKAAKKPKRFVLPKINFPKINFSWAKNIPQITALPKAAARKAKAKAAKISNRVYKQAKQIYEKLSK